MRIALVLFQAYYVVTCVWAEDQHVCVTIGKGDICGFSKTVFDHKLNVYLGIPYAKPPIGKRRFKRPITIGKWDTPIQAKTFGKSCLQNPYVGKAHPELANLYNQDPSDMSEDCLTLNVWSPQPESSPTELLPVMIWIHGGAFVGGSSSLPLYNPEGMAAKGHVVVVSMNYRLGLLGFGSLGIPEMPGNQGLLDQRLAIKWVVENIAKFGGDPGQMTLFGESAGGAAVAAHLAAPKSRVLFNNAFIQSGTILNYWSFMEEDHAKLKAQKFAESHGCTANSIRQTLDCLQMIPEKKFMDLRSIVDHDGVPPTVPIQFDELFFGGDALQLLREADLSKHSIVVGATTNESVSFLPRIYPKLVKNINDQWAISPEQFAYYSSAFMGQHVTPHGVKVLMTAYNRSSIGTSLSQQFVQIHNDQFMVCGAVEFAIRIFYLKNNGIRFYLFNNTNSVSLFPKDMGSFHTSEIPLHMGKPGLEEGWTDGEVRLSKEMVERWTDFAKERSFNKDWPQVTKLKFPALVFENDGSRVVPDLTDLIDRCSIWWKYSLKKEHERQARSGEKHEEL